MSEYQYVSVHDVARRATALQREAENTDSYYELDEIQLVRRYDEIHALEQLPLFDEQRQLVAFISNALLDRIENKITPSFRRQLEQEAQQTNQPEEVRWVS